MAVTDTRPAAIPHPPRGERRVGASSPRPGSARAGQAGHAGHADAGVKTLFTLLALIIVAYAGSLTGQCPGPRARLGQPA